MTRGGSQPVDPRLTARGPAASGCAGDRRRHGTAHRRPGARALPGRPAQRARRHRAAAVRRLLRHLRPRQPGRHRPGAAGGRAARAGRAALLPGPQRAGHGAHRGGVRPHAQPAAPRFACTSSVGPGATNMVTGAALATINRLPVLLLPGDVFATRVAPPVLQELEYPGGYDVSVNDAFRPVSVFFDRIWRPEQLPSALLGAMRALTDPAATGAVTLALPQDVQAEARDWPRELFAPRVWHVAAAGAGARRARPRGRGHPLGRSARSSWPAAGSSTPRPPGSCGRSPRRPASRSPKPRPGRAPCGTTTRWPWARSAAPARPPPTGWPPAPTW